MCCNNMCLVRCRGYWNKVYIRQNINVFYLYKHKSAHLTPFYLLLLGIFLNVVP